MFSGILDEGGAALTTAIFVVSLALLALLVVFWIIRLRRPKGHLTRDVGGRREPRLAVLDTAPVDARRRLILIRRDDTEHLILIGGPNDLLVESRGVDANPHRLSQPVHASEPIPRPAPAAARPPARPRDEPPEPVIRAPAIERAEPESRPEAIAAAPAPTAHGRVDVADRLEEARGRVYASGPTEQFPPERFDTAGRTHRATAPKGVEPGNPFDEQDFSAILDEQLARQDQHPPRSDAAPRQQPSPAPAPVDPVVSHETPAKRGRQDNPTLEEEMARLLRDMTASRR